MIIFRAGTIDKFWLKYALSCEKVPSRNAISAPSRYLTMGEVLLYNKLI